MQIRTKQGQWMEHDEFLNGPEGRKKTITERMLNEAATKKLWEKLKIDGSQHYKTGGVECVDLYRSGKMFRDWAMGNIIGYAFRCRREFGREPGLVAQDMRKIIDIANKMIASFEVEE